MTGAIVYAVILGGFIGAAITLFWGLRAAKII